MATRPKAPSPSKPSIEAKQSGRRGTKGATTDANSVGFCGFGYKEQQKSVRGLLEHNYFDAVIGVVIALNAGTLGIEQTLTLNNDSTTGVRVVESLFLIIYIVELGLRCFCYGSNCFRGRWVRLDTALVALGILDSWVLEPMLANEKKDMGPLMLLRTVRLLRLTKTVRSLARVQEFRMLSRGLVNCSRVMVFTLTVLVAMLYCFSILGIEVITKHGMSMGDDPDPDFQEHVSQHFSSVPRTMLTLVQFVTLDHVSEVYLLPCRKDPWLTLYFVAVLLVIPIILMNLVTAVLFSSTLDAKQSELDNAVDRQEKDWGSFISNLKKMFNRIDEDKSGCLTLDEFLIIDKKDQQSLCRALNVATPIEIFKMLDHEKRGEVSINEFFDCMLDKVLLAAGDDKLKRMERQVETMHWRLKETFSAQNEMLLKMGIIQNQMRDLFSRDKANGNGQHFGGGSPPRSPKATGKLSKLDLVRPLQDLDFPSIKATDRELEAELSSKMRCILEENMQSSFERLQRLLADSARAVAGKTLSGPGRPAKVESNGMARVDSTPRRSPKSSVREDRTPPSTPKQRGSKAPSTPRERPPPLSDPQALPPALTRSGTREGL